MGIIHLTRNAVNKIYSNIKPCKFILFAISQAQPCFVQVNIKNNFQNIFLIKIIFFSILYYIFITYLLPAISLPMVVSKHSKTTAFIFIKSLATLNGVLYGNARQKAILHVN